jgi:hypothetical protein
MYSKLDGSLYPKQFEMSMRNGKLLETYPMKLLNILIVATLAAACTPGSKDQAIADSTAVVADTIATPVIAAATIVEEPITMLAGELTIKGEDTIMDVSNQWSFISDPYDFSLDVATIQGLLGDEAKSKEENYEGGEDYDPYSYYTINYKDSEISFYSYPGKHFSTMKRGIKIGMSKNEFLTAMNFAGDSASHVTLFRLFDDYGSMDFRFRADTLNLISASYEEGD